MPSKSILRVGNVSGATGDASDAMFKMVTQGHVDAIVGDWLSEMNIAWNAIAQRSNPEAGYEEGFLQQLEDSIDVIVDRKIKVVTNAGALNTASLTRKVEELCQSKGHGSLTVAAVYGDNISHFFSGQKKVQNFRHLDNTSLKVADWELEPYCGTAYIGAWGIVAALNAGADIVICGRVTDASPVIGLAAWWYGWKEDSFTELAGALVAGHLIECGPYATGANFSGFKEHLEDLVDLGFPIAEIDHSGSCIITKHDVAPGFVSQMNITAQLLYELQGEMYLNTDVVADLSDILIEDGGKNRVAVSGVKGHPPPDTTKAMIAAIGGYQAEATFYINGLDVAEKAQMMRNQLQHAFRKSNFSKLSIELYGCPNPNPRSQQSGTVQLRVFAQARQLEDISAAKFRRPIYAIRMQSYPGYHMNLDFRTMDPKPFMELFPALISIHALDHHVCLPSGERISIPPSTSAVQYPISRPSYETTNPVPLESFGLMSRAPLGSIVHARSGDKANNSNVGFFVRNEDEYPWLQAFLTVSRLKELFGDDWKEECRVERCEFPRIRAVHFRILDFLDGGIASSSRLDGLGKGVGEYLRSRVVDVPQKFLERGSI